MTTITTICAAEGCDNEVVNEIRPGRRAIYCSIQCRPTAKRATGLRVVVEVDHVAGDEEGCRPLGRVWLVRMRRGRSEVVVAQELGRPSADHLAGQIADLIGSRRQRGGSID